VLLITFLGIHSTMFLFSAFLDVNASQCSEGYAGHSAGARPGVRGFGGALQAVLRYLGSAVQAVEPLRSGTSDSNSGAAAPSSRSVADTAAFAGALPNLAAQKQIKNSCCDIQLREQLLQQR
jgi:hypothetical protein